MKPTAQSSSRRTRFTTFGNYPSQPFSNSRITPPIQCPITTSQKSHITAFPRATPAPNGATAEHLMKPTAQSSSHRTRFTTFGNYPSQPLSNGRITPPIQCPITTSQKSHITAFPHQRGNTPRLIQDGPPTMTTLPTYCTGKHRRLAKATTPPNAATPPCRRHLTIRRHFQRLELYIDSNAPRCNIHSYTRPKISYQNRSEFPRLSCPDIIGASSTSGAQTCTWQHAFPSNLVKGMDRLNTPELRAAPN